MIRPNIVENPLEEPIYHTLGKNEEKNTHTSVQQYFRSNSTPIYYNFKLFLLSDDNNETVYINADLEVVYPLPEGGAEIVQGVRYGLQDPAEDETEAELNGLLADR